MPLDIRPANQEDVDCILSLILPYLPQAQCTGNQSQFASINVDTRIPGLRWCWEMHGPLMSFRPHGFPHGRVEFRATIMRTPDEYPSGSRLPAISYVVCPRMIEAYEWIRLVRGSVGKNRVREFLPNPNPREEFELLEYQPPYVPKAKPSFMSRLARILKPLTKKESTNGPR